MCLRTVSDKLRRVKPSEFEDDSPICIINNFFVTQFDNKNVLTVIVL